MRFAAVEVGQLLEVVWVSLLSGVAVTAMFSLVVLGGARSAEARRSGRTAAAWGYGGLATLAFLAFGVGVAYGLQVMLSKD